MHKKEFKFLNAAKLNKYEDLRKIIEKIDKAKIKRKLKENFDVDVRDSNGNTALHHAAKHGNIDMMTFLVSRGSDIESTDKIGWRPISYACANKNLNAVSTLIQWKSEVNKFSIMEENSPLHIAAGFGHVDIVKLLLENGANVHISNKKNQTPMDVACENNHYGVVNVFLSASSKLIEDTTSQNLSINNFTPSITSSLSKSSLFIKSASINNANHIISRLKSGSSDNTDFEFKRRTIGSQCQLNSSEEILKPKKSGSLNTVFLSDQTSDKSNLDNQEYEKIKPNKLNNSEIEVNLPYPSKFSTSEKLKIKSPLLATKNWKLTEKMRRNNPSVIENFFPEPYCAQFIFPTETEKSPVAEKMSETKISNMNSISPSYNQDTLSKQLSMTSINNPHASVSFGYSQDVSVNSIMDLESKLPVHCWRPPSIRREFGSENDIIESPNRKDENVKANLNANKSVNKNAYIRSPSLQEYKSEQLKAPSRERNHLENNKIFTCYHWIKSLGLTRIWDSLFKEGFESFLALTLATDDELLLLCNNSIDDWDNLKRNLESLKIPALNQLEFSAKISEVLLQLGLECYINNFYNQGYIDTEQTKNFEEKDLNELEIYKKGHRKLILTCFSILQEKNKFTIPSSPSNFPELQSLDRVETSINRLDLGSVNINKQFNLSRKPPPPIPSRTSSIIEVPSSKQNLTLDDILVNSNTDQVMSKYNKKLFNKKHAPNPSSLDDIVNILQNLGKELDLELNNI